MKTRTLVTVISLTLFALLMAAPEVCASRASWFSVEACLSNSDLNCPTASGRSLYDLENQGVLFAAMWSAPFGTKYKVTNLDNGKSVIVEIWDRGPARRLNRVIDLGKLAFSRIADLDDGVINVEVERL